MIPTFDNARFIKSLLNDVLEFCNDVIVINDGCTDHTSEVLAEFGSIEVITFPKNRGKGQALKAGFDHALKQGYELAITLDSDNQHAAKDLPAFLNFMDGESNAIVIGSRMLKQDNVPRKNRFANRLSSFWFKVETGVRLKDTQSGYRLYPLRELSSIKTFSGRYEFELEIKLEELVKFSVDVRVLNKAPITFVQNVIRHGIIIIDNKPNIRADFESYILRKYFDFAPFRRQYLAEVVNAPL